MDPVETATFRPSTLAVRPATQTAKHAPAPRLAVLPVFLLSLSRKSTSLAAHAGMDSTRTAPPAEYAANPALLVLRHQQIALAVQLILSSISYQELALALTAVHQESTLTHPTSFANRACRTVPSASGRPRTAHSVSHLRPSQLPTPPAPSAGQVSTSPLPTAAINAPRTASPARRPVQTACLVLWVSYSRA